PITLKSITDENNKAYKYSRERKSDTITYKIGDANIEVKGENTYIIKYRVENAIRTERYSYDELYWNVLGNFWDLEIDNFRAKIIFPQEIKRETITLDYYAGELNSKSKAGFYYIWLNDNELEFKSGGAINKRNGLTVSATFPKDIVSPYEHSFSQKLTLVFNNLAVSINNIFNKFGNSFHYTVALLFLILAIYIWRKFGREPKINRPVIAEYEPPENLSPIEIGSLLGKGFFNYNSIIPATIINLAVKGYLKIEKIEKTNILSKKDYKFIKLDKVDKEIGDLYKAEEKLFENIFVNNATEIKLTELKTKIKSFEILKYVSEDLKKRGLVDRNSFFIGIGMMAAAVFLFIISQNISYIIAFSSFILGIFGLLTMNRLTFAGAELKHKIKGFKLYMKTAETYRSRFYEKEGIMEKYLPYAIGFGITKEWLNNMKNIYGEEYFNNYHLSFMAGAILISDFNDLNSVISDISNNISSHVSGSSSGAGGSGFSGGGGGGGGGGGW
ncbi:DUF2207 domain-containing protein, partial [Patescibacteria group bacterium]|nr:DUF2207 domain-containing protein [Patescibacteria group bacterium]